MDMAGDRDRRRGRSGQVRFVALMVLDFGRVINLT